MKKYSLIICFLSLLALPSFGQEEFRKNAPKPGPAPKIELGDYDEFTLDNGLKVITVENHKIPRVSFQIFVDAPPIKEGEFAGAADMAGQLLNKGTEHKSKAEIDAAVDFIGASLNTSASGLFGASLTKHKDQLLELMADVLLNPTFPEEEFEKLKKQTLSNLASEKDDPNAIAGNVANVLRYGADHPYGELATEETVENITLDKCKAFYNTYFKPNASYLVIVGDIKAEEAKKVAEKYFSKWEKGTVTKATVAMPAMPSETTVDFVAKTGAVQSVLAVTYPVELKPGSEDVIKARVMNTLFGGYFRSRLNNNIREDKGFSYGVRSSLNPDRYVGYFTAGGSVRNEVTDSSIVEFLKEMNTLRNEKVSEDELTLVKNVLSGSFARALERPETVARFALNTVRYELPNDYYATYLEKVSKVTPEDIQAMAQKYLNPHKAHILVVGNKEEVAEKLEVFAANGEVNFYDTYGNEVKMDAVEIPEGTNAGTVLEDYINAIGGTEKLETINDLSVMMTATVQGMGIEMNLVQKAPDKMSLKVSAGGMVMQEQKYDGEKGMSSQMGQKTMLEGEDLESMKMQAMLFPERKYHEMGYKMNLVGIEPVEKKNAYKIEIESPNGRKTTEFYDVETSLKVRTIITEGETTIIQDFLDYREVVGEDIKMPYLLKTSGVMPFPLQMQVQNVEVNKGVEDTIFTVE